MYTMQKAKGDWKYADRIKKRKEKKPILDEMSGIYYAKAIIFLISAMALPGFRPLGQVREQLRMVWQRYTLMLLSRAALRSAVRSSRESTSHR
jgi:hypothetical protein